MLNYEDVELDLIAIEVFFMSDKVFISPRSSDFKAKSSLIYASFNEIQFSFIYFVLKEYDGEMSKLWIKRALKSHIYVKGLTNIGVKSSLVSNVGLTRTNRHKRLYHGVEIRTPFLFGVHLRLLKVVPKSDSRLTALKKISSIVQPHVQYAITHKFRNSMQR